MNKLILPVIVLISVLFIVAGMTGDNKEAMENSAIIEVTSAQELNDLIEKGPVIVEVGAASVAYINADKAGALASSFTVSSIPDSFVIVENGENGYVYMGDGGQTTTDRISVRFLGLTPKNKFTNALDSAIEYRN
jgi:hypothetical protein